MEFGVVVTEDRHVYEFDLVYGPGDLTRQAETARVSEWRDVTAWWASKPARKDIEEAFSLLQDN